MTRHAAVVYDLIGGDEMDAGAVINRYVTGDFIRRYEESVGDFVSRYRLVEAILEETLEDVDGKQEIIDIIGDHMQGYRGQ